VGFLGMGGGGRLSVVAWKSSSWGWGGGGLGVLSVGWEWRRPPAGCGGAPRGGGRGGQVLPAWVEGGGGQMCGGGWCERVDRRRGGWGNGWGVREGGGRLSRASLSCEGCACKGPCDVSGVSCGLQAKPAVTENEERRTARGGRRKVRGKC